MIPRNWLFRDLDQDYGIDGEVEIFDLEGEATGRKFLVQLKATDQERLRRALRLSIKYGHGDYYQSLALPVLFAICHAPSSRLYWCWFHALDPYDGRKGKSSVSFVLPKERAWSEVTGRQIETDLDAYFNLKSPVIGTPLEFELRTPIEFLEFSRYDLVSSLRELCSDQPLIRIKTSGTPGIEAPNAIELTEDSIQIRTACGHGFSLHLSPDYGEGWTLESLCHDLVLGIGLALHYYGHSTTGAGLVVRAAEESWLARSHVKVVWMAAFCLAEAGRLPAALDIAERVLSVPEQVDAAMGYVQVFLESQLLNTTEDASFGIEVLMRIGRRLEALDRPSDAGVTYYNAGNLARRRGQHLLAVRSYRLARKLEPSYSRRAYWWREIGGVLFLSGRYRAAESAYRRSLELEQHRLTAFLHADSLLFTGEYSEALARFQELLGTECEQPEIEWWLKARGLQVLINVLGISSQRRDTRAALELMAAGEPDSPEATVQVSRSALELDALCATAWYNLGHGICEVGEPNFAFQCYLMAALVNQGDIEAWSNAAAIAMNDGETELSMIVVAAAFQANGEAFLRRWRAMWPSASEEERAMVERACEQLAQSLPPHGDLRLLRMHDLEGTWDELQFQKRPEGDYSVTLESNKTDPADQNARLTPLHSDG